MNRCTSKFVKNTAITENNFEATPEYIDFEAFTTANNH